MIDKQTIILGYHRHGKSKKQLSRELGLSLTTIKKFLFANNTLPDRLRNLIGEKSNFLLMER
ncbi:MAG: lambda repressor-like predicted transcriptional regulator [Polaribacter sp.]|jgi:lambda repressor-like predicted transcriptional regulator